jgi:hypothetical protein
MSKYLTVCNISDTYNILESFSSLISKLQILCSYQIDLSESLLCMIDAVFTHILTCAKTLYFNGSSALQIADLIFNIAKFTLDNATVAEKYGSFESIVECFLDSQDANERFIFIFSNVRSFDEMLLIF